MLSRLKTVLKFIFVTSIRNIHSLLLYKLIAVFVGVSGVGILGNFVTFFNFQSRTLLFGSSASLINTHNQAIKKKWDSNLVLYYHFVLIVLINFLFGVLFFLFHSHINQWVFESKVDFIFLIAIALLGTVFSFSYLKEAHLQAEKKFDLLTKGRSLSLIFSILLTYPLIYFFGIKAIVLSNILIYLFSLIYFRKSFSFSALFLHRSKLLNWQILKHMASVGSSEIARTIVVLGSVLIFRVIIVQKLGMENNGFFQALWQVSNLIITILTGFVAYYYPTINAIISHKEYKLEFNASFKMMLVLTAGVLIFLMLFYKYLLILLFNESFLQVAHFLPLLIISKLFYFFFYIYTINFLGLNHFKLFLGTETIRSIFLLVAAWYLMDMFGFKGLIWATAGSEFIGFMAILIVLLLKPELRLTTGNSLYYLKVFIILLLLYLVPAPLYVQILITLIYAFIFLDLPQMVKALINLKTK